MNTYIKLSNNGDTYSYDSDTNTICKNGIELSSMQAEPIFSEMNGSVLFSGLYLRDRNSILTLSGKLHSNTDSVNLM